MSIQYTADQLQRKFQGAPGSAGFSRLAEVLRTDGRLDEAIQVCQDGLRAKPNALSGYVVLGKALMDSGRMDDAREQFEAALRLDPRCLSAMHFLARIMTQLQWADAAAGYYRSILEVEPWDAEIRALLGEASPGSRGISTEQGQRPATQDFAPASSYAPSYDQAPANAAAPGEEETFEKPDGFAGDVLEVNLNDVAADFLPSQEGDVLEPAEESLEDALSGAFEEKPRYSPAPPENLAQQGPVEPLPKDILRDDATGQMSVMGEEPAPISGQDVEDRLDSLFGIEDTPSSPLGAQPSGWSPAPPEPPAPELPPSELSPSDYSVAETDPSATATGEMRKVVDDGIPASFDGLRPLDLATVPDLPKPAPDQDAEPFDAQDFSDVDFVTPARVDAAPETGEAERVQGEDIEQRLDELFNLTESDVYVPGAASLPTASGPKVEEAVALGEVVSFGGDVSYREDETIASEADVAMDAGTPESKAADFGFAPDVHAPAQPDEEIVTGQDVADKLDNLFGEEPVSKSSPFTDAAREATQAQARGAEAGGATESYPRSEEKDAEASPFTAKPWPAEPMDKVQPPPTGDFTSTESMLPPGWFGVPDASSGDGSQITGSDVEAQLDRLFHIEEDGETIKGLEAPKVDTGDRVNTGDTVSFQAPMGGLEERPAGSTPGDESDRTVLMPAMREPAAPPKDSSRIKDSVADWLARQNVDADQKTAGSSKAAGGQPPLAGIGPEAGETMILPAEDFEATLELPSASKTASPESPFAGVFADDPDTFGTLAPEDLSALSETTSIEMIDGEDVAGRLDELFADEGTATVPSPRVGTPDSGTEMSLFIQENGEGLELPAMETGEGMVSGEDVTSRLHEIFEPGNTLADARPAPTETTVPAGLETEDELLPAPGSPVNAGAATAGTAAPQGPATPALAPMTDEEDGYPEEEEMPQSGAGANVATVTLAEIYFQQGLREQALQIYRQLLEREPENDSVRKRIEEIEATKPEGGDRDPGSDPRRPRPGLKVPKRKK